MLSNIEKLQAIAKKPARVIIGLMSGTSLDGLDIAVCEIAGQGTESKLTLKHFETIPYPSDFRSEVQKVFSKKQIDLAQLTVLNPWIGLQHAAMVNRCLKKWGIKTEDIDLIASHGQTIYHAPKRMHGNENFGNATLQIGDADQLAVATGIITIGDFRQKNIAAGGEGAPLAVYGDFLLFGSADEDRILLNIGGIANFTYLPAKATKKEIQCSDIGPGNTMMDAFMREHFDGKNFDLDAAVAGSGKINEALLTALKDHDFFHGNTEKADRKSSDAKTTGPELFNMAYLKVALEKSGRLSLSVEDTMATLNKFSADMILLAIKSCLGNLSGASVFVSGGGVHNPLLMQHIKNGIPDCKIRNIGEIGVPADAKEAVLFALLANESVCGKKETFANFPKGIPAVSMGKISFPG